MNTNYNVIHQTNNQGKQSEMCRHQTKQLQNPQSKNQYEYSVAIKHKLTLCPVVPLLGIYSREMQT